MNKTAFLATLRMLYRVANASDTEYREAWTKPEMAGNACCRHLDKIMHELLCAGVITADERQAFYDTI